jgi:GNAT superfamily N-acetyltransferase
MYTVRPARREDAEALFELIDALADYEKLDRPDADARARLIRDGFETAPPRFFVFLSKDAEGRAVGYAIAFETYSSFLAKPTLYIEDLFVLPSARGSGAGDSLFRHLCGEAVRRGCGRMEWVCLDWNRLAIDFYEKRGAEHLDDWRYYRLGREELHKWAPTDEPSAE